MFVSYWQHRASPTEQSYLDEAIRLGEKILEKSTNDYTRHSAVQILCFTYSDSGETNKAIKLAYTMPLISVSQESLLAAIQKGDDGYRAKQCEMYNLLQFLSNELANIQMTLGSGEKAYTEEECAALRDKQIALLNLFYENGDFSFYHTHLCEAHREQAAYYARIGNSEQTLSHLEKAAEHAIKFIIYSEKGEESTSLVFRGMLPCIWSADETDNDAAKVLHLMESSDFDFVRETESFGKIKARLSEHAGKWEVK